MTGHLVRELRKRIQWSQEDLAEHLGVDRATVSRIENGGPISGPVLRLLSLLADQHKPVKEAANG